MNKSKHKIQRWSSVLSHSKNFWTLTGPRGKKEKKLDQRWIWLDFADFENYFTEGQFGFILLILKIII